MSLAIWSLAVQNVSLLPLVPGGNIFYYFHFAQRGSISPQHLFDINISFCTFNS